jgi:hypothetical protein
VRAAMPTLFLEVVTSFEAGTVEGPAHHRLRLAADNLADARIEVNSLLRTDPEWEAGGTVRIITDQGQELSRRSREDGFDDQWT